MCLFVVILVIKSVGYLFNVLRSCDNVYTNSDFFVQNKGSILKRNYNFSPSGFFMNLERFQFIDFTSPLFENRVGNYVNRNKLSHSFDWAFFIRPFNNTSWICSLGNKSKRFFIFLFALRIIHKWRHSSRGVMTAKHF